MTRSLTVLSCIYLITFSACNKKDATREAPLSDAVIETTVLKDQLLFPWEILWGPDNKIWMTEKNGTISRLDTANGDATLVYKIADVAANGEGGLLGMALHPDFNTTPEVFVVYDYSASTGYKEKVVKYTYANNTLSNPIILLDNINAAGIHNGSRLLFTPDKKLLITTGDAGNAAIAQDGTALNGKILRINTDGTIPADNPDPTSPIWTKGHRNPQGLAYANGVLYSSEHGPSNDDEINIIEKGRNFGWPNVQGFCDTDPEKIFCGGNNVKEPIYAWTPTLAVCGIEYYHHDAIPQWKNSLLMATLKDQSLYLLKLSSDGSAVDSVLKILSGDYGRLRDVCISPDGKVYIATSNGSNDKIVQVRRSN